MLHFYLDQRDLIDFARSPATDLIRVRHLVDTGRVQTVLSFAHALETWKYQEMSSRVEVSHIADELRPVWLLNRDYLFLEEARNAILEAQGITIEICWHPEEAPALARASTIRLEGKGNHRFCPFRSSPLEAFLQSANDKQATMPAGFGMSRLIEAFDQMPEIPSALLDLHQSYADQQPYTRALGEPLEGTEPFIRFIFECAMCSLFGASDVRLSGATLSTLVRRCPSLFTYVRLRESIHRDRSTNPDASEMVDLMHVTALP